MIDSHCHLADAQFKDDLDIVIRRAQAAGISSMICIADSVEESHRCKEISNTHSHIYFTVGTHPHNASSFDIERDIPVFRTLAQDKQCKAIGEIGLDYHYMNSPKDTQQRVFEAQLMLAKELDLPAVVHCREAVDDVWTIVDRVKPKHLVVHCCTEKWENIKRFTEAGYYLSFTAIATYPNALDIRETVLHCPINQMMIETDSPYLPPASHRGKRNEPMYLLEIARILADMLKLTTVDFDHRMTINAKKFFRLIQQ